MAEEEGVAFITTKNRNSHHGGDWQAFLNALVFARQEGCDIAIKISQRLIPVFPAFWEPMFKAFEDPAIAVAVPGRLDKRQMARPSQMFFTKFPLLTDVLAMRVGEVKPEMLMETYQTRFRTAKTHHDTLVEFAWNHLVTEHFMGRVVVINEWSTHEPFKPKLYLRKSQSTEGEYKQIGDMDGVSGPWILHDWAQIERKGYVCRPKIV